MTLTSVYYSLVRHYKLTPDQNFHPSHINLDTQLEVPVEFLLAFKKDEKTTKRLVRYSLVSFTTAGFTNHKKALFRDRFRCFATSVLEMEGAFAYDLPIHGTLAPLAQTC